jgi:hypothetical protein
MNLNPEFADYLTANGYRESNVTKSENTTYFFKDDLGVMVSGDSVDVGMYRSTGGCKLLHSFTGISTLETFDFILLMHITGAVPLKEFFKNAKVESPAMKQLIGNVSKVYDPHANISFGTQSHMINGFWNNLNQ